MKVRFLNSCMSSEGMFTARREYEMADDLAQGFIDAGHAEAVEPLEEPDTVESIEEAVIPTEPTEQAVLPRKGRRK